MSYILENVEIFKREHSFESPFVFSLNEELGSSFDYSLAKLFQKQINKGKIKIKTENSYDSLRRLINIKGLLTWDDLDCCALQLVYNLEHKVLEAINGEVFLLAYMSNRKGKPPIEKNDLVSLFESGGCQADYITQPLASSEITDEMEQKVVYFHHQNATRRFALEKSGRITVSLECLGAYLHKKNYEIKEDTILPIVIRDGFKVVDCNLNVDFTDCEYIVAEGDHFVINKPAFLNVSSYKAIKKVTLYPENAEEASKNGPWKKIEVELDCGIDECSLLAIDIRFFNPMLTQVPDNVLVKGVNKIKIYSEKRIIEIVRW